jgi:hypothetical protein
MNSSKDPEQGHDQAQKRPSPFARSRPRTLAIAFLLFAITLLIYLPTLAPGPLGGDAGEFQTAAKVWGLSHPTGYPLYMLLLKAWSLLPLGTVAFRANLLAAVLGAATVGLFYVLLDMVTRQTLGSIVGALVLAASPLYWSQALIADKYALNALLVAGVLAAAVYWAQEPQRRRLCLLALAYGFSLAHHRTMLLFAPGLIGYLLWVDRGILKSRRNWLALLCLVLPLGLYATLPLARAYGQPLSNWWPSTPGEWLVYLTARGHLGEGPSSVAPLAERVAFYGRMLVEQFTIWGLALSAVGWVWLIWRRRPLAFLLLVSFLLQAASSMAYYLDPRNQAFFLPSFLILAVTIGAGAGALLRGLGARQRWSPRVKTILVAFTCLACCLLPAYLLLHSYPEMHDRHHHDQALGIWRQDLQQGQQARRLAEAGLPGVAPGGDWEQVTPLRYYQWVEGLRPDVEVLYPLGRLEEAAAAGRPLYVARTQPGLADRWHPSASGPLIALHEEPVFELPPEALAVGIQLGKAFELAGYGYGEAEYRPATVVPLTLYWRALEVPADDYSVSLRLFDGVGQEVYKVDSQHPVLGTYPTSRWAQGEVVADYYEIPLPPDLAPGGYQWGVLLYRTLPEGGWENLRVAGTESEVAMGGVFEVR